ncbi:MAG: DUF6066 family protein [Myxococcales bacterium]
MRTLGLFVLASTLLAPLGARADNMNSPFARLRDRSKPLPGMTAFLDKYVGDCGASEERQACSANVKKTRAEMEGNTYYVILGEASASLLKPAGFNPATREFRIDLTPFFEGGGRALTDGAPKGQDAQGRPRIPLMTLVSKLPDDWTPMDMDRLLRTGNVKIHLVFQPQGVWSLPGKGGDRLEGVKAKLLAVRLTNRQTGDELALHLAK